MCRTSLRSDCVHGELGDPLKLQESALEVEDMVAERRVTLDNLETITALVGDMGMFLNEAELTERRAFIQSFVKETSVGPGKATILYNIPMPEDGALEGTDTGEVALPSPVRYMVRPGTPARTRTGAHGLGNRCSIRLSYRGTQSIDWSTACLVSTARM